MNSEFPMTFQDDSQSNKAKSKKSNIIPLSKSGDVHSGKFSSGAQNNDFPLSQFGDEEAYITERKTSAKRYFVRGFLLTVLAGLWIAVGTGNLHSESDEIEAIRSMIHATDNSDSGQSSDLYSSNANTSGSAANANTAQAHSGIPSESPASANGTSAPPPSSVAANPAASAGTSQQAQTSAAVEQPKIPIDIPQTLPQQLAYKTAQAQQPESNPVKSEASEKVSPVAAPADEIEFSDSDVKKTARFLRQQQKQMLEMEEHLTSMIARSGNSELAGRQLMELEEQHRQAAAKLKERRTKLRQ